MEYIQFKQRVWEESNDSNSSITSTSTATTHTSPAPADDTMCNTPTMKNEYTCLHERKIEKIYISCICCCRCWWWNYLNWIHLNHLILLILFVWIECNLNLFKLWENLYQLYQLVRKYFEKIFAGAGDVCVLPIGPAGKPFSLLRREMSSSCACDVREKILIVASLLIKFVMDFISLRFASLIKSFFFSFFLLSSMRISAVAVRKKEKVTA